MTPVLSISVYRLLWRPEIERVVDLHHAAGCPPSPIACSLAHSGTMPLVIRDAPPSRRASARWRPCAHECELEVWRVEAESRQVAGPSSPPYPRTRAARCRSHTADCPAISLSTSATGSNHRTDRSRRLRRCPVHDRVRRVPGEPRITAGAITAKKKGGVVVTPPCVSVLCAAHCRSAQLGNG